MHHANRTFASCGRRGCGNARRVRKNDRCGWLVAVCVKKVEVRVVLNGREWDGRQLGRTCGAVPLGQLCLPGDAACGVGGATGEAELLVIGKEKARPFSLELRANWGRLKVANVREGMGQG